MGIDFLTILIIIDCVCGIISNTFSVVNMILQLAKK